ncbi:MAG TPA: hypothetical protein VF589_06570 [Allosphingosinicella sp.]|jgi:hypothetical protein
MIHTALAAALLVAQVSPPAAKPCLNRAEAADLALLMLPGFVDGLAKTCGPRLPQTAFLRTGSGALSARIRSESAAGLPRALAAFAKTGDEPMPPGVSAATMRQLVDEVAAGLADSTVKPQDCAAADEMIGALSPLPAANLGNVVAVLMQLGAKSDGPNGSGLRMCAAAR